MEAHKKKINNASKNKENREIFRKGLLIRLSLIVLVLVSFFIFIKQYKEKQHHCVKPPLSSLSSMTGKTGEQEVSTVQPFEEGKVEVLSCPSMLSDIQLKYITVGLIEGALEGKIQLTMLKEFLQIRSETWAQQILSDLNSGSDIKTYVQLEDMLIQSPVQNLSLWQRLKMKFKSLIRIRKLDKEGNYTNPSIKDLIAALEKHDLKSSLALYKRLSPMEQDILKEWEAASSLRFSIETIKTNLLNELAVSKMI